MHHRCDLCSLAFGQLKRWSCACFCPHTQYVSVSSCPNLSWYALKCPWPDLAAISHPWTSLFSLSLGRDFARKVGFRPNFTYACAAPEKFLFCHSNSQLLPFAFLSFCLALLRDWAWSCFATYAHFFTSWSANSFPSIPAWPGIHWTISFLPVWSQPSARSLNCLKTFWIELLRIQLALRAIQDCLNRCVFRELIEPLGFSMLDSGLQALL